ncbi:hypothetical protein KGR20_01485 [Cytobacillus oceanisediminis]|jgi:hypothetical protein|uniref:UPF0738 protein KD144_11250 n=2 Tax=Niallia TaxID=2837506 RepID=A0A941JN20_NIACI|nr:MULTISPECIES: hypothetical protein [Bacillaceae]EOR22263.1 hypothetical protein A499_18961 [Niallia nealsonii AAU1]MBQ6448803.1 hypothetical protein [Bacillus sp. (in: firmicutes)]MDU1845409.1 hypothetical protein [Niallia nealsonii]MBZ9532928.1 hypothetical protein [Cytobacillus oceanisediminis]MCB5236757.1 hypothetical protein [Niallia circulans]
MKQKWKIKETIKRENELVFQLQENAILESTKACGQILVDSDSLAFIYLLEKENEYVYLEIPEKVWKDCKEAVDSNDAFFVKDANGEILLESFKEEIEYLIENIRGNGNYGEDMEKAVSSIFLQ